MKTLKELPNLKGGYWYLATPYSKWVHGLDDANIVAQLLAARIMYEKVDVYTPIGHTHGISKQMIAMNMKIDPRDHSFWMKRDKPLFDAAGGLLVADLPGWKTSTGVTVEIDWCRAQKKPVFLLNPKTLTIKKLVA